MRFRHQPRLRCRRKSNPQAGGRRHSERGNGDGGLGSLELAGALIVVTSLIVPLVHSTSRGRVHEELSETIDSAICGVETGRDCTDGSNTTKGEVGDDGQTPFSRFGLRAEDESLLDAVKINEPDNISSGSSGGHEFSSPISLAVVSRNLSTALETVGNMVDAAEAKAILEDAMRGCGLAFKDGTVGTIASMTWDFLTGTAEFVETKIAMVQDLIDFALYDTDGFIIAVAKAAAVSTLDLDLLGENKVQWATKLACDLAMEALTGFAKSAVTGFVFPDADATSDFFKGFTGSEFLNGRLEKNRIRAERDVTLVRLGTGVAKGRATTDVVSALERGGVEQPDQRQRSE